MARNACAFRFVRPWPMVCVTLALAASCTSTYCAIGYVHYKHITDDEALAAQRAERANADLQGALDRLRNELELAEAQIATMSKGKPEIALSEQYKSARVAQLTQALERLDLNLSIPQPAAKLSPEAVELAGGRMQQTWARICLDQTQRELQQLGAERDDVVGERGQFQDRVRELEQTLSLLESRQAPDPAATATVKSPSGGAPVLASAPPSAAMVSAPEQPRQVLRNFAPPGWVPDHFTNERGAILGNPNSFPPKRALKSKDEAA